jgi:hypothetical protein
MIVWTERSRYEIDLEGKRIRRLTGLFAPTPRQGADGHWRGYQVLVPEPPAVGEPMMILWAIEIADEDADWYPVARTTMTSDVVSVE